MELNKIYHMDNREGLKQLPEKCANLIISDPPYFEVKGEFDFVWKDFDEYLRFMEEQAQLYKRILADNGTLFVYGHSKRIAYVQVIFDKYFNLENNLTWNKAERDGMFGQTGSDVPNSFPPCTERILMYSTFWDGEHNQGFQPLEVKPVQDYLVNELNKTGLTDKCLMSLLGYSPKTVNKIINGQKDYRFITQEKYTILQNKFRGVAFEMPYKELKEWRNRLYNQYEQRRRPFFNLFKLNEVLNFRFVPSEYEHDTVKPEKLTRALILTCSRKNDLVVVPFAGSGTECAMAAKEGRRFIGFDVNPDYVEMSNKRTNEQKQIQKLF